MTRSGSIALFVGLFLAGACGTEKGTTGPSTIADLEPGSVFKDCDACPEMVVVPAGSFKMGSTQRELERPVHTVTLAEPFAVGKYEVTFEEWDACVADGGCDGYLPDDEGWGRGRQPVINVSWRDARSYVWWLRNKTGRKYRLPSESEWEYTAKGGVLTQFWWGLGAGFGNANCRDCGSAWDYKRAAPVGMFDPNGFGLFDTAGNVWEWVNDCLPSLGQRRGGYALAPTDGSAELTGGTCYLRAVRGGSWSDRPWYARSAHRNYNATDLRDRTIGFRVARDLK